MSRRIHEQINGILFVMAFLVLPYAANANPLANRFAIKCELEMVQVDVTTSHKISKDDTKTAIMPLVPTGAANEFFAESDVIRFSNSCERSSKLECSSSDSYHGVIVHAFVDPKGAIDLAAQILFFADENNGIGTPIGAIKMTYSSSLDFLAPNAPSQTISYYNPYVIDPHLTSIQDLIKGDFLRQYDLIRVTVSKCEQINLDPRAPSRSVRGT